MEASISPESYALTSPEARKSLVEKLAEACEKVGGVEKKGRNDAQRYDYVRATDVAKAIRRELFKRGIVIIPHEVECVNKRIEFQNAKGETRHSSEVVLNVCYVITDGVEELRMNGYGIAWDAGDKAIYKAKTGSMKYFLRGLGLIPDEKDDPEADETIDKAVKGRDREETDAEFDQRTEGQQCIARFQVDAIIEACKRTGKTEAETAAYLGLIGHKRIEHLLKSEFPEFLKWANSEAKKTNGAEVKPASKIAPPKDNPRDKAMKRLWAVAAEEGIPEKDVKSCAYQQFGVDSMTKLDIGQIDWTTDWVKSVAAAVAES